jgi:RNA polymerase sigma-70 factor (ECF subfamily)
MAGLCLKTRRTHPTDSATAASSASLLSEEQERDLLRQVAAQDRQAFETLYRQYAPRLYRYLCKLIPQPDLIEEVFDDVMLVVWQKAACFDGTAKSSTWILGIAYHKALKARVRLPKPPVDLAPPAPAWHPDNDPAALSQHRALQGELARALAHLSLEQRTVVELAWHQGCSYQEIATIMGCPVNTVKTRMWLARQYLTRALTGLRASPPPEIRQEPGSGRRQATPAGPGVASEHATAASATS